MDGCFTSNVYGELPLKRFALFGFLFWSSAVGVTPCAADEWAVEGAFEDAASGTVILPASPSDSESGWFGDIGFYVLRPQWGSNPAFSLSEVPLAGTTVESEQTDFDHGADFAPLVSVGYSGSKGLGLRARWWTLGSRDGLSDNTDDTGVDILLMSPSLLGAGGSFADSLAPGEILSAAANHRLNMDVIDFEGIWESNLGRTSLLFSSGIRYAHMGQQYDAGFAVSDEATGTVLADARFHSRHTFNGAGPTVSLKAYRHIGETRLAVYGLSRGSLLYGERRQNTSSVNPFGPVGSQTSSHETDGLMPVAEFEVGANWTRRLNRFDLFVEGGFVGQAWFNAGNAANSDNFGLNLFSAAFGSGAPGSDNANQTMGLVGLKFTTGVRF